MRIASRAVLAVMMPLAACTGDAGPGGEARGPSLALVDSVVLQEGDSAFVGVASHLAVGGDGSMYISDPGNAWVLEYARDGRFVRRFGRKGSGPGEFQAPLASVVIGDSLLAVADWGQLNVSLMDLRTGEFKRSVPHQGLPFAMQAVGDTIWMSAMFPTRTTAVSVWPIADDSVRYIGQLPQEYIDSPPLREYHPFSIPLRIDDHVLVGFTGHPALFLDRSDGSVIDTIEIPAIRRRPVPHDLVERFKEPATSEEVAAMQSSLMAMHRLPSKEIAVVYFDITLEGRAITAAGYLSLLSPDLSEACVDVPLDFSRDARPTVGFRGDTLLALEQRALDDASTVTFVRSYLINSEGCDWVETGG